MQPAIRCVADPKRSAEVKIAALTGPESHDDLPHRMGFRGKLRGHTDPDQVHQLHDGRGIHKAVRAGVEVGTKHLDVHSRRPLVDLLLAVRELQADQTNVR